RPRRPGREPLQPVDPRLLAGDDADPGGVPLVRLGALGRVREPVGRPSPEPGRGGAPEPRPRHGGGRGVHADDALVLARGDAAGLRPDGPREGTRRARGRLGSRPPERPDPADHRGRPPGRLPPRRRGGDRGSLHPARRGPAPPVGGLPAGLSARPGDDSLREPPLHAREPLRRPDLRRRGPADPSWIAAACGTPWWPAAACSRSSSSCWPWPPAGWRPTTLPT